MMKKTLFILIQIYLLQIALVKAQNTYSFRKIPISTDKFNESAPAFFLGGIAYCSDESHNLLFSYRNKNGEEIFFSDLWLAEKIDSSKYKKMKLMNGIFNSRLNDGPISIDRNNELIVLTKNIEIITGLTDQVIDNKTGIFFSEIKNNTISKLTAFKYNSNLYNIMHASLHPNGNILFFASDMNGGYGGFDIYYSEFIKGFWTHPKNIGNIINTSKNEIYPFIHESGRLYFSSESHNSLGGYDIFFSQKSKDEFNEPVQLKSPINSNSNDLAYIIDPNLTDSYFASDRDGTNDLFNYTSIFKGFNNCKYYVNNNYCYTFFEQGFSDDMLSTSMKMEWDLGDGNIVRQDSVDHCFAGPGTYNIKLNIIDNTTNELAFNQADYVLEIKEIEQANFIAFKDTNAKDQLIFEPNTSKLNKFEPKNYYWDFGDKNGDENKTSFHKYINDGTFDVRLNITGKYLTTNSDTNFCVIKTIIIKNNRYEP